MKKLLRILTGIVFLTAILVVGGCKSTTEQEATETIKDSNKVKIYLTIKKINGKR